MSKLCSSFHQIEHFCVADNSPPEEVRARIEVVVKSFLRSLMAPHPSVDTLSLVCRTTNNTKLRKERIGDNYSLALSHVISKRKITTKNGVKCFVRVWKVIEACYQLLGLGRQSTQRELFYRMLSDSPDYFTSQRHVNAAIQDAVALLHCSRHCLGLLASSRGALAGRLIIQEPDGETYNCSKLSPSGYIINGDIKAMNRLSFQSDARYILVVEKDAIFQRLTEDRFFQTIPCIVITAKGYPDLASRVMLHRLHKAFPALPILTLVDWNPAGLAIIWTYKFGSMRMGLEAAKYVCDVKWLGLRSEDLPHVHKQGHLSLTTPDKALAKSLLASRLIQNHEAYGNELRKMLEIGIRVEIEALYTYGYSFLSSYIMQKIVQEDYI